jgi:hypothetical protein
VSRFFNLFHPFDPVAYRVEPLVDPALGDVDAAKIGAVCG